jgi:hypothetical protein
MYVFNAGCEKRFDGMVAARAAAGLRSTPAQPASIKRPGQAVQVNIDGQMVCAQAQTDEMECREDAGNGT